MIKLTTKGIRSLLNEDIDLGTESYNYPNLESLQSDINNLFPLSRYSVYFDDDTVKSDNSPPKPYFVATDINDDSRIFHITIEGVDYSEITFKL